MSLIRPDAQAALWRFREVFVAVGLALVGVWLAVLGGYLLLPLGAAVVAVALAFGVLALRRLRFAQKGDAPGVVELDEGQIRYFGPKLGGALALRELDELRLVTMKNRRMWRLRQQDGQVLLIPVEAAGAELLFDPFASLPGMDSAALVAAVSIQARKPGAATKGETVLAYDSRVIWRRPAHVALT